MTEKLKKNDFIEINFTGRVKDGDVFDSTLKEELEKLHASSEHKVEPKPFVFPLGHEMFLKYLDEFLIGKEVGKKYTVELEPENAFGKRDPSAIQRMPSRVFREQKINPYAGAVFNFDGKIGKVIAVSGGRIMVDFNSPLAGKHVVYELEILRKVEDIEEKIKALNEFFFKKNIDFSIKDNKIIFDVDEKMSKMLDLLKEKYKEILGMEVESNEPKSN